MNQKKCLFGFLLLILIAFPLLGLSSDDRGIGVWGTGQAYNASWGNYHALIVGINAYKEWRPLKTAVKDAQALKEILIRRYGFAESNVTLRTDNKATRLRLINDLRNLASSLGSKDNLLIYFAGHGQLDDLTGDGYWIPVEGKLKDPGTWISHSTVKNILSSERVRGKNIVVVADSCYSGTLLRGGPSLLSLTDQGYRKKLANLASCRSRQVITSGGVEPVADGGRDGHSLFAYYFLKSLKENDRDIIDLENLFHTRVWKPVTEIGGQRPNVGRLKTPMDEDGQFVLASSGVTVSQPVIGKTTATLSVKCNVSGAKVFLDNRNLGSTPLSDVAVSPGEHKIKVEKNGYEPYRKRIRLEEGRSITLQVSLSEERSANGRLFVETEPEDARVRILNIVPRFYQGIELEPGRYHVEVSASGHETKNQWVELGAGEDKYIDIRLNKIRVAESVAPSGKSFTNSIGMKFVLIPNGSFMMGSPSNEPKRDKDERQHRVTISKSYYMQTTEVTQGQWSKVMGNNPSHFKNCGDNCPVENVSWNDAQQFIRKLNQREGANKYRLPTEAEWEYACRAGTVTPFFFGECLSTDQANYDGNNPMPGCSKGKYRKTPVPVESFSPNAWGLYDMHGNVWEWCQDWYGDYFSGHFTDPTGPSSGKYRVLRGGSWLDFAGYTRSANRGWNGPDERGYFIGFRVARTF